MTVEQVKDAITAKGLTQADLARKGKVSRACMALFINRKMTSARLEKLLAKELGVTVEQLRGIPTGEESNPPDQAA